LSPINKFGVHPGAMAATAIAVFALPALPQQTPPPVPAVTVPESNEPEITVEDAIRRALANNPQSAITQQNFEAIRQRLLAARKPAGPTLLFVPGLGNRNARDEEIILAQPLDLFGRRRARVAVGMAELRRGVADTNSAIRTLTVTVKTAAAELFAAQEAEALSQTQVEVARLFREAAARRAELGDVPPVQVQRAELELLRGQNDLTNARAERLEKRATLNQLIGQDAATPLRVAAPTPAGNVAFAALDLEGQRAQLLPAIANRPDIFSAQATVDAWRRQADVLRADRRPEVELQARRSSATGSGSTALRAVITVPLFDPGANRHERLALEAEARAGEARIALLRTQAAADLEKALLRWREGSQTAERYRTGIVPLTLDLLRKTQIGYAQGASSYLEVLEAQRTLRQVQSEYTQALAATLRSEAQIETALGAALPAALSSSTPTGLPAPPVAPEGGG